jgi:hypothetical protein
MKSGTTVKREGVLCRWCEYPLNAVLVQLLASGDVDRLCETCIEWCEKARNAHNAIEDAAYIRRHANGGYG